ncbi:copine-9-like [Sitodiplosis mosellana]|uniref:copine-9-like n=1 Tax=Sitodiplosis mosellana TaxID=263140 RepID=UPI002443DA2A|nr:copine-9-like [Sitodiplosis mosellana]
MPPPQWSNTGATSARYITDDQLAPFVKDFLPTSQVELTLSCRNLINADIISKSDPFCIIWMKEPWQDQYYEVTRTETIDDNLNPQWVKKVILNYNFETIQKIQFEVRDEDLKGSDFLGRFETTLSDLVSHNSRQFVGKLSGIPNRNCGEIVVVTEEVTACKQIIEVQFSAQDIARTGWLCLGLCSNDPFLVISRSNEDGSYSVVAKTAPVLSTQHPTWRPITIKATTLCNGDPDRTIKLDVYDHRNNGSHKLIGTCHSSLSRLNSPHEPPMNLVDDEKRKNNPNNCTVGVLRVDKINITEDVTFLEYIRNGTQMHFAVAIDFTASNGVYTDPRSLHYLSGNRLNPYEVALRSVGEIIQNYDESQLFPAFGFGAKLPPTGQVFHQFPLNDNPSHPYCSGVEEILNHYRIRVKSVTLYGPTNFAPVINNTISIASQFQDGRHYFVLLIITDGIISDMHLTKRAVIEASSLPISIIIVGVGDADFDAMDELDSDDVRLTVDGRYAERDIVQFVPLNKFMSKTGSFIKSQTDLAKEVLAEIPEQLTSFMKSRGIRPQIQSQSVPQNTSSVYPTAPIS